MVRITLVCASGMSTSMLVAKMQEAAKALGVEADIIAIPDNKFSELADRTDVLLLGPQVRLKLKKFQQDYEPRGIKVALINMTDYGRMNGEKVFKEALKMTGREV